ncbi:MAG: slr1659 superfamily regulator [Microcoleaceae cyanobacterium]|jgi:hypothetical protein
MEVKNNDFSVYYDSSNQTIFFQGTLRLNGDQEYAGIMQLLEEILKSPPPLITLNLERLEFLNSSGINTLSKFTIKVRRMGNISLLVIGSKNIFWQQHSLQNLQRLFPRLKLEYK